MFEIFFIKTNKNIIHQADLLKVYYWTGPRTGHSGAI